MVSIELGNFKKYIFELLKVKNDSHFNIDSILLLSPVYKCINIFQSTLIPF